MRFQHGLFRLFRMRRRYGLSGGAADESGEGVAGQEFLFLDRVGRAVLGDCFGEQGVDGAFQRGCELHAGERVEGAAQVPHAVGVGPGGEPDVGLLALETIETVTGLQAFDFELESTPELIDGARCGDCSEVVRAVEQLVALVGVQLFGTAGDGVDVPGGDCAVGQRIRQVRCRAQGRGAVAGFGGLAEGAFGGVGDDGFAERFDGAELQDQRGFLRVGPPSQLTRRDQRGADRRRLRCGVGAYRGDPFRPLGNRCNVHASDSTDALSQSSRAPSELVKRDRPEQRNVISLTSAERAQLALVGALAGVRCRAGPGETRSAQRDAHGVERSA